MVLGDPSLTLTDKYTTKINSRSKISIMGLCHPPGERPSPDILGDLGMILAEAFLLCLQSLLLPSPILPSLTSAKSALL